MLQYFIRKELEKKNFLRISDDSNKVWTECPLSWTRQNNTTANCQIWELTDLDLSLAFAN